MNPKIITRPDVDIEEDIRHLIRSYDPLKQAQHHVHYTVSDGHVILQGHVRSVQAHRVLIDNVPDIEGVVRVNADGLFDDETVRLEIGQVVPAGVIVRVNYGHVVLTGPQSPDIDPGVLVPKVQAVPGVIPEHVTTSFY
ncbi:MAG: BON domain-containing protein [Anaerolineales bacterium]